MHRDDIVEAARIRRAGVEWFQRTFCSGTPDENCKAMQHELDRRIALIQRYPEWAIIWGIPPYVPPSDVTKMVKRRLCEWPSYVQAYAREFIPDGYRWTFLRVDGVEALLIIGYDQRTLDGALRITGVRSWRGAPFSIIEGPGRAYSFPNDADVKALMEAARDGDGYVSREFVLSLGGKPI